jgi:hypothetical protein
MFLPSSAALVSFLQLAYLRVRSQTWLDPCRGLRALLQQVRYGRWAPKRVFTVCAPLHGVNELHGYKPPFGLEAYDDRFRLKIAVEGYGPPASRSA